MESLHWIINQRQQGLLPHNAFSRAIRDSSYLVKRLRNTRVLEGHHGCVNSVSWNEAGTKLISGSDDCHINIYDMATDLMCHTFHTSHQSNIFSAKFLPQTGDCKAVSCAGIGSVEVSELTPYGDYVGHQFKCQSSITYQVATSPGCPHEFFACEEMGIVRMYDLRTCSSCHCDGNCNRSMLCRFPSAVTSMAVHPLEPHYIVVGLGDGTLRLLDRRWSDSWQDTAADSPAQLLHASCLPLKYRPAAIRDQKLKITSVNFNLDGTQIVASYSEDYVYLFNSWVHGSSDYTTTPLHISRPQYLSQCERYPGVSHSRHTHKTRLQKTSKTQQRNSRESIDSPPANAATSAPSSSLWGAEETRGRVAPAHKRIRLRGDWSDTGPEARPEDQESEEPAQEGGRGNLMNRMSRLFERWMDMALDSVSGDEGEREGEETREEEEEEEGESGEVREEGESGEMEEESDEDSPNPDERLLDSFIYSDNEGEPDEESMTVAPATDHRGSERQSRVADETTPDEQLRLARDVAERAMVSALQEAVHQTMNDSLSWSPQETGDTHSTDPQSSGDRTSGRASAQLVEDAQNVGHSPLPMDTGRTNETDTLPLSGSGELNPLPDDVITSPVSRGVPASPLLANVREASPSSSPSSMGGRRSLDRSPDHSYRRSRFKVQRKRGERSGELAGGSDVREKEEEKREDGGEGDTGVRRRNPLCETCPTLQPFNVYKGHRNSRTMIKQANFFGENWVLSGSDCGRVFVWDKWTGEVVNMFTADSHVVNCVQPHPSAYLIATSGIDYNVKLWEPVAAQEASLSDLDEVMRRNEQMLQESRNTITIPSSFLLRILAYLNRSGRMRSAQEQQQSEPS